MRAALGAGRGRVVAQLMTESLVLASMAASVASRHGRVAAAAPSLVPIGCLAERGGVVVRRPGGGRLCATALAVGMLFGIAPAWQSSRGRLADAVSSEGRSTRRGGWVRSGLVSVQIAAAVLVLCGAGLLLRTLIALQSTESGARATEVLTGGSQLPLPVPGRTGAVPDGRRSAPLLRRG